MRTWELQKEDGRGSIFGRGLLKGQRRQNAFLGLERLTEVAEGDSGRLFYP
jgi:hypothetical protein